MEGLCDQDACTVAETGKCLLNADPNTCSHRIDASAAKDSGSSSIELDTLLEEPAKNPRFSLSQSLTPGQTASLMEGRYCRLVGIVGTPDAGKTAALVSLYLLLAHNSLSGYKFGDSKSLQAFDEISRGARRWSEGQVPSQFTVHTELKDDRTAGYLHLRLKLETQKKFVDLLLPDLPGEWSTELMDKSRIDRLGFLNRADVIWLMVDGRQLSATATRHNTVHRTVLLMTRLSEGLVSPPPLVLVVTRSDSCTSKNSTIEALSKSAVKLGLSMRVISIASFSDNSDVPAGSGLVELVSSAAAPVNISDPEFWPITPRSSNASRSINCFRTEGHS